METIAYAVISEALANTAKHASGSQNSVYAQFENSHLVVEVRDSGPGGADPARGTGLTGLADRAAVAGGRRLLSRPAGGPTVVRVELPCAS